MVRVQGHTKELRYITVNRRNFFNVFKHAYAVLNIMKLTLVIGHMHQIFAVKIISIVLTFCVQSLQKIMDTLCATNRTGWKSNFNWIVCFFFFSFPFIKLHFSTLCDRYASHGQYKRRLQKRGIYSFLLHEITKNIKCALNISIIKI